MKLPGTIYVKISDIEGDKPIFSAEPNSYDLAEKDETVLVGTYQLIETNRVRLLAESKQAPNKDAQNA